jgi:uncharacterized lipoprotein YmbA
MKSTSCLLRIVFVAVAGMFFTGCLLKPATVSTRYFILTPMSTNKPATAATDHLSVGVGFVKMPSYLLRNSMAVRNGANEIEYLEDVRWSERLDECFQRALAANLSRSLPSDNIYLTDWRREQVNVVVLINVQQFDVDIHGHGTLTAQWRITAPDSDISFKSGVARLARTGASPRGKPENIAATMSELAAEFSSELAESIRESEKVQPVSSNSSD